MSANAFNCTIGQQHIKTVARKCYCFLSFEKIDRESNIDESESRTCISS